MNGTVEVLLDGTVRANQPLTLVGLPFGHVPCLVAAAGPLRITHVTDCYVPRVGGIELQVQELARRQVLAGHDVHIITASPSDEDGDDRPLSVHRLCPRGPAHVRFSSFRQVGELIGWIDPDVVHVHASVLSPLAAAAAVLGARMSRPTVITVHSLWAYLATPYRLATRATRLNALPIHWTSVSACAAEQVRRVMGSHRQVAVIPNGIDADYWRQTVRSERGREVVVAAVMRLNARKRPLAVLSALHRARSQLPASVGLRAVILGDGPQRELMNGYLAAHRMRDWVELPGTRGREQVRELLSEADVFIAAARLESFGVAALEARCVGVPIVAHAGTGIADFVRDGRDGLLVSGSGLAPALCRLTASSGTRVEMTELSRSTPPPFGWSVTLAAVDQAYASATALARSPSMLASATTS